VVKNRKREKECGKMLLYFWLTSIFAAGACLTPLVRSFHWGWMLTFALVMLAFCALAWPLFESEKNFEGALLLGLGVASIAACMPGLTIGMKISGYLLVVVVALLSAVYALSEKNNAVKTTWMLAWGFLGTGLLFLTAEDNDLALIPFLLCLLASLAHLFTWRNVLSRMTLYYGFGILIFHYIHAALALVVFRSDPFGLVALSPVGGFHSMCFLAGVALAIFG
jgi:hypothetical protein